MKYDDHDHGSMMEKMIYTGREVVAGVGICRCWDQPRSATSATAMARPWVAGAWGTHQRKALGSRGTYQRMALGAQGSDPELGSSHPHAGVSSRVA